MRKIDKRQRRSTQAQTLEAWLQYTQHTQYLTKVETHLHKGWAAHTATRAFSIWNALFDSKEWLLIAHARCRQRLREHAVLDRALASWNTLKRPRNTHTQAAYVGDQRQRRRTRWMTEVWRVWQTCRAEQADAAARDIKHERTLELITAATSNKTEHNTQVPSNIPHLISGAGGEEYIAEDVGSRLAVCHTVAVQQGTQHAQQRKWQQQQAQHAAIPPEKPQPPPPPAPGQLLVPQQLKVEVSVSERMTQTSPVPRLLEEVEVREWEEHEEREEEATRLQAVGGDMRLDEHPRMLNEGKEEEEEKEEEESKQSGGEDIDEHPHMLKEDEEEVEASNRSGGGDMYVYELRRMLNCYWGLALLLDRCLTSNARRAMQVVMRFSLSQSRVYFCAEYHCC